MTHFVDGRPIAEDPIRLDMPLRIGDAEIGNWDATNRPHTNPIRYFGGCMDEFLLFSRALAGAEIEQLYERGRLPL